MRNFATPKRVTVPNGRTFLARYKGVPRSELPAKVTMARRYSGRVAPDRRRRRSRKGQRRSGFFYTSKKQQKNPLVKQLGKKALTYTPKLYKYGASKVKSKTARKILNSAAAEQLLNRVASYGANGSWKRNK